MSRYTGYSYKTNAYKIGGTSSNNTTQPQTINKPSTTQPFKQVKPQLVKQQVKRYTYQPILRKQPQKIQFAQNTKSIYYSPLTLQVNAVQKGKDIDNSKEINKPVSGYNEVSRNKTQTNSANNDYLVQIYTKQALRQILTGKFTPNNSLKNVSTKLNDIFTQFNTNYSAQRVKYESFAILEQTIKNDILSILKEKYSSQGRNFYQMTERTKLQNQSIDKIYDQVKRLIHNRQRINSKASSQKNIDSEKKSRQVEEIKIQLQKSRVQLQNSSKKKQQEYAVVVKENNYLKDQLKKINQQLSKGKESVQIKQNQLILQISNLSKQNNDLKRQLQYLSNRSADVANLKDAKQRLEKDLQVAKQQLKKINDQKSSFQTAHNLLLQDFQQIKKNQEGKERMLRGTEAKNIELSKELNILKQNLKTKVNLQTENQNLRKQIQKYRLQYEKLQKSNNVVAGATRNQIKDLNDELKRHQDQNELSKKQIMQLQNLVKEKQEKMKILQGELQRAKKQITEIQFKQPKKPSQQLQKRMVDLQKHCKSLNQEINRKDKQIKQNVQIIKTKNVQISELQKKQYQLTDQLLQARKEIETMQEKVYKLQKQRKTQANQSFIRMPSNDNQKLLKQKDQEITNLKKNLQLKTKQFESAINEYEQADRQHSLHLSKIQKINEQLTLQKTNASKIIKDLQKQVKQLKVKMSKSKVIAPNSSNQNSYNMLYQHQLLDDLIQYKKFLTNTIESRRKLKILKTRMIYHYDPLNRVNFHRYIDGVSNLLLILKTQNGSYTAAFTESAFSKEESTGDGILISLNNKKYFTLIQQNKRAISYDEYYIIFGNSQLRIRSMQNILFSNFGISNSYYDSKGQKVSVLLGSRDREVQLQFYEIYQVIFDDY